MTNLYLIEDEKVNLLVVQNGSVLEILKIDGIIENGVVKIYRYLSKYNPKDYYTYTTNYDLLASCKNMGLNIRYGSIEDEIITDYENWEASLGGKSIFKVIHDNKDTIISVGVIKTKNIAEFNRYKV